VQLWLFEQSSRENATPIKSSKMSHPIGVHDRMLWLFHSLTWAIHSLELTWQCYDDSVFQHWLFMKSSRENALMIP
jgi:hypothetical protein